MPAACLIIRILQWLLTTSSCGFRHRKQTSPTDLELSNEQHWQMQRAATKTNSHLLKIQESRKKSLETSKPDTHLSQKLRKLKISL